jgi:hypothetical protein
VITPRTVRLAAVVVCAGGIAGMIVTSIADHGEGALAFGLATVVAVAALLLMDAVAPARRGVDEVTAEQLEREIAELVDAGAEERRLRRLVALARRLGPPTG